MAPAITGCVKDAKISWRKAIPIALTENPTAEEFAEMHTKKTKPKAARPALRLFEDRWDKASTPF